MRRDAVPGGHHHRDKPGKAFHGLQPGRQITDHIGGGPTAVELDLALVGAGEIGVGIPMLEHGDRVALVQRGTKFGRRGGRNNGKRERHAKGGAQEQQFIERVRVVRRIVVAPPECGSAPVLLPEVELAREGFPCRFRLKRAFGHRQGHGSVQLSLRIRAPQPRLPCCVHTSRIRARG